MWGNRTQDRATPQMQVRIKGFMNGYCVCHVESIPREIVSLRILSHGVYTARMAKKQDIMAKALALHKKLGGKLRIEPAAPVKNRTDLSLVYTPGVGFVADYVVKHPKEAREYTMKGRMVAVISDGSAVLGLGNIGALGALPVMEGK